MKKQAVNQLLSEAFILNYEKLNILKIYNNALKTANVIHIHIYLRDIKYI